MAVPPRSINIRVELKGFSIRKGTLKWVSDDYIKKHNGVLEIPDSATKINDSAVKDHQSLEQVTIPHSVTIIGKHSFTNCGNLKKATIPDSVTNIGLGAFSKCHEDLEITITTFDLSKEKEKAQMLKEKLQKKYPNITIHIDNPLEHLKSIPTFFSQPSKPEDGEHSSNNQNQPGA